MKISHKASRDGNINPTIYNYLHLLTDDTLHHNTYNMRHPLAIYNMSLGRVISAFVPILDEIDKVQTALLNVKGNINYDLSKFPTLQKELLDSLLSHIDDCYHILKTIYPPSQSQSSTLFVEKWLEEVKHPTINKFKQDIKTYRDSLAPIVNHIKHGHGRVRSFIIYSKDSNFFAYHKESSVRYYPWNPRIPGYYIEGVQADGKIGPDPKIHPQNTAISLNYDLRYHFVHIYLVGLYLKNSLVDAISKLYKRKIDLPGQIESNYISAKIENVAARISKLPTLFFPDEFDKTVASVIYRKKNEESELTVEYPSSNITKWQGKVMMYFNIHLEDRMSTDYQLPYGGFKFK
ncbi:hypothetical protein IQ259_12550 [Fortiea sp. LEGE XX443]|uniref:hypothetical protein n=1 Tax=Fortiea sp. LEGE XX443 TaxID=1828611 RepID=UPI001882BDDB|nr:hypothetical protein [Fortiea sp. LEGE XX443]MBE9005857.1 hypothetical protein [Fortiea sp. LEGE XX443]